MSKLNPKVITAFLLLILAAITLSSLINAAPSRDKREKEDKSSSSSMVSSNSSSSIISSQSETSSTTSSSRSSVSDGISLEGVLINRSSSSVQIASSIAPINTTTVKTVPRTGGNTTNVNCTLETSPEYMLIQKCKTN